MATDEFKRRFAEDFWRAIPKRSRGRVTRLLSEMPANERDKLREQFVAIVDKHHARGQRRARAGA